MSKVYSLKAVQKIPAEINTVWDFFSRAENLLKITPADMKFKVVSKHHGERVYPGQILEYKVTPIFGISFYWMTEITHVAPQRYFADEQRYGPFSLWHHQHHFQEIEGGVEMTDIIHYKLPLSILGDIAHSLLVRKKLKALLDYRYKKVEELFGRFY